EQKDKILKCFNNLIDTKPGVELLDRILKHNVIINIDLNPDSHCSTGHGVSVKLKSHSFFAGVDKNEKIKVHKATKESILAHELLHLLHRLDRSAARSLSSKTVTLLHPNYDNEEEQHAITGLRNISGVWSFDPLCENSFYAALKKDCYRIFHRGISKDNKEHPHLADCIYMTGAKNYVRDFLEKNPDALNQLCLSNAKNSKGLQIRPLTAAMINQNWEVFEFLIAQEDLEVYYEDDFPNAFVFLLKTKEYKMALKLLKSSRLNSHQPNSAGVTPFMIFIEHLIALGQSLKYQDKEIVKEILSRMCEGVKWENLVKTDLSKFLSCASLSSFLSEMLIEKGCPIDFDSIDRNSSLIHLLKHFCENIESEDFFALSNNNIKKDVYLQNYEKIKTFLSFEPSLSSELNAKILNALAKGVVDYLKNWEDEKAKECLELLIKLGGKIKEEHQKNAEKLLKGDALSIDGFSTTDFFFIEMIQSER
ncbi:MAG: hypothetical protein ACM3JI_00345, partial [Anaerolineae bacterium]